MVRILEKKSLLLASKRGVYSRADANRKKPKKNKHDYVIDEPVIKLVKGDK